MSELKPPVGAPAAAVLAEGRRLLDEGRWVSATLQQARADVVAAHRDLAEPVAVERVGAEDRGAIESAMISIPVRLTPADPATEPMVRALHRLALLLPAARPIRAFTEHVVPALAVALPQAEPVVSRSRWMFAGGDVRREASVAYARVDQAVAWASANQLDDRLAAVHAADEAARTAEEAWAWWSADPAAAHALRDETVGLRPDLAGIAGRLSAYSLAEIENLSLDGSFTRVELRPYQHFGARFLLVQRRAILGDEVGLGKKVQALAALAHLRATGAERALVLCPDTAIGTWQRALEEQTSLPAHVLRAHDTDPGRRTWLAEGGLGLVSAADAAQITWPDDLRLAALVVDEAHRAKNPGTAQAQLVARLGGKAERVWFLTGSNLAARPSELANLVQLLKPSVQLKPGDTAPVYLRRTTADVWSQLPPAQWTDDWVEPTETDARAYRDAVWIGNFSSMRRVGFGSADPAEAGKIYRLLELVGEARDAGHRVVVHSYFLSVLTAVTDALRSSGVCPRVLGPLTSSTPPADREKLLAAFAATPDADVLALQLGPGAPEPALPMASVAVFCEPQLDPRTEAAAVGRLAGDPLDRVQVHRLLLEQAADERIVTLLREDPQLGDSEVTLTRHVVADEQSRLGVPLSR